MTLARIENQNARGFDSIFDRRLAKLQSFRDHSGCLPFAGFNHAAFGDPGDSVLTDLSRVLQVRELPERSTVMTREDVPSVSHHTLCRVIFR